MSHGKNQRLSYITRRMIMESSSIIGKNMQLICKRYNFNNYQRDNGYNIHDLKFKAYCDEDIRKVNMIYELRDALKGIIITGLDKDQITDIIYNLCF